VAALEEDTMNRTTIIVIGTLLWTSALAAGVASARPETFVEAKKAGFPSNNCQYCHTTAMPKKETFKPEELNDRGKFLLADMQQRKLKAPDVTKLKEYKSEK
jgi:hypothetical protein